MLFFSNMQSYSELPFQSDVVEEVAVFDHAFALEVIPRWVHFLWYKSDTTLFLGGKSTVTTKLLHLDILNFDEFVFYSDQCSTGSFVQLHCSAGKSYHRQV